MRLNIGCGSRRIDGYVGVDAEPGPAVDVIATADKVPLESDSADEVLAVHLVEHIQPHKLPFVLREWWRLLKPDRLLVLELPDIMKACRNIVEGYRKHNKHPDHFGLIAIYGEPREENPLMLHRWGYSFETLKPVVAAAGFRRIVEKETRYHGSGRHVRDFRLEAIK